MPLASLIQVPFIWVLGPTAFASALPFALAGATAAPLAWAIAATRRHPCAVALGAGILTAIPGLSLVYMVQPDNFSLYQPLVAASLWMPPAASRAPPIVVLGGAPRRAGDAVPQRRRARARRHRPDVPL